MQECNSIKYIEKRRAKIVGGVVEFCATDVDDLLKMLRLDNKEMNWAPDNNLTWVFRGQKLADWDLKPSSRRSSLFPEIWKQTFDNLVLENIDKVKPSHIDKIREEQASVWTNKTLFTSENIKNQLAHVAAEQDLIHDFIQLADKLGLTIPGDIKVKNGLDYLNLIETGFHPTSENIMESRLNSHVHTALAQHSGIPTEMLDWSGSPINALFFALKDIHSESKDNAVIWALNNSIETVYTNQGDKLHTQFINISKFSISNLNAQDGMLQYFSSNLYHFAHGEFPSLNKLLESSGNANDSLRKIIIKREWVDEIRRYLWIHGVHSGRMMPSFESVGLSLMQKLKWGL